MNGFGCGLDGGHLPRGWTVRSSCLLTSHPPVRPDKATRRQGQEGYCTGVNAKSVSVRPAVACIGSKQGSLSLSRCARAATSSCSAVRQARPPVAARPPWRTVAGCACFDYRAICRNAQTWRGGRGRNWRRSDVRLAPGGRRAVDGGCLLVSGCLGGGVVVSWAIAACRPCP